MLSEISDVVSIFGIPLALIGILLAYRDGRNSRDLDAALVISDAFTDRWSSDLADAIIDFGDSRRKGVPPKNESVDAAINTLGWLNSVGLMIDSQLLARPSRVVSPIKPLLTTLLNSVESIIAALEASDPERWRGVRILVRALGLPETDLLPRPPDPSGAAQDPQA
jgi:hypothetical protein